MRITGIGFENIHGFQDEVTMRFPRRDEDYIVITGEAGTGKTNLIRSLLWCLTGSEASPHIYSGEEAPLISAESREGLHRGAIHAKALVCLDVDGVQYVVERKALYLKEPRGEPSLSRVELRVAEAADGSMKTVTDPDSFLKATISDEYKLLYVIDTGNLGYSIREAANRVKLVDAIYRHLAQEGHEDGYLSRVLSEEASRTFESLTSPKYGKVDIRVCRGGDLTLSHRGRSIDITTLSASDAIFLAFSVLTALWEERGEGLPVMLDDPFERLDEEAKARLSRELRRVSRRQQVLLFTEPAHLPRVLLPHDPGRL